MEKAFRTVEQLVRDFNDNEAAYLVAGYQESQVRQDFIDKFFTALGWDVTHERQKNPYEQEVTIEKNVQTAGSQRRADYAFFIAPNFRDVKFFVEAKKPAHDLKNPDYYHQAIRYGWNQGTPLAVLTDFEEFHILDCRYKPDIKTALAHSIKVYHYKDYSDKEKFAEIFYLFGRDAVADGSVEKFAATLPKPRGKAIQKGLFKGGYQPVDEAFLEELDGYRETLAKAFKKENQELEGEELTEAVQRTIDRLVFIRFLEDKQIEENAIIAFREKKSAWGAFLAHCRSLEPKYNGLVFKPHRILDGKEFNPPDDTAFADICNKLADPSSPYDFNHIPISILGSIYERFLGKVVHATDKRVTVTEKPEVRKAGGVYYTPEYIVRYIVKETVGKLIEGKTPEEIAQMAFADIACGSGSFLIEVYSQLLEYHARDYAGHPKAARKEDIATRDGKTVLSLKKRQEILLNNIYGVDIDFQATEVTQLSLYLKLLEDATTNDAYQFGLLKEKILPDLRNNIICGNSLIGTDILEGDLFGREEDKKLNPMNFTDAFPKIMRRGGFDAVVGNPPYISIESIIKDVGDYFHKKYRTAYGRVNSFSLFFERYVSISKQTAKLGFIVSNRLLTNTQLESLRAFLLKSTVFKEIVSFKKAVFTAAVDTVVVIFENQRPNLKLNKVRILKDIDNFDREKIAVSKVLQSQFLENPSFIINLEANHENEPLIRKIKKPTVSLEKICEVRDGIILGTIKDLFLSNKQRDVRYKKFLDGGGVSRYSIVWDGKYICYDKSLVEKEFERKKIKSKKAPTAKEKKKTQQSGVRLREASIFEQPKILTRQNAKRIIGVYDDQFYFVKNSLHNILQKDKNYDLKFVLAILNSKLMDFYFQNRIGKTGEIFSQMKIAYIEQLPIHTINFSDPKDKASHDHIVKLVEHMLAAKEQRAAAKTEKDENKLDFHIAALDRQIDEAVYELYGLTEEEIKVVEGE